MANKAKMEARQAQLTYERLIEVLSYDPETGIFIWKKRISIRIVVGKVAGVQDRYGHRIIRIDGTKFMAHRLAWFYVHKIWPEDQIDHRDTNRDNNAIVNLRQSTQGQNLYNMGIPSHNTSGYKGVCRNIRNGRWIAQIRYDNRHHWLGEFDDPKDAHNAYVVASKENHREFGRTE